VELDAGLEYEKKVAIQEHTEAVSDVMTPLTEASDPISSIGSPRTVRHSVFSEMHMDIEPVDMSGEVSPVSPDIKPDSPPENVSPGSESSWWGRNKRSSNFWSRK